MPTYPYIHFQGQCAEAMAFYKGIFTSPDLQLMHYREAPEPAEAWRTSDRVMHAQLNLFDGVLMASDYPPGEEGAAQAGFSVMQTAPDLVQAERVFKALAEAGQVIQPFAATFFTPGFGMVVDKFGTHWIISAAPEPLA